MPYCGGGNGYDEMHIYPSTTPVPIPWEPGVAMCLGYSEGMDHKPVPSDPRQVLFRQLERAKEMGLEIQVGSELEFYLLDPETKLPRQEGIQVYGINRQSEMEHVLGPIRDDLIEMGIPIEQSNPEYAAGQAEVNVRYSEALSSADNVVLFRTLVK